MEHYVYFLMGSIIIPHHHDGVKSTISEKWLHKVIGILWLLVVGYYCFHLVCMCVVIL